MSLSRPSPSPCVCPPSPPSSPSVCPPPPSSNSAASLSSSSSSSSIPAPGPTPPTVSRPLGDSELSYFLPSRADGVNDMYLHIGFRAPPSLVSPPRMRIAWAILRGRHPLLASRVIMAPYAYDAAHFQYTPPASPDAALADAAGHFETRRGSRAALLDAYLNGPRTLAADALSRLVLSTEDDAIPDGDADADVPREYDLLLCAAHFLGDGMALHACANDLFVLLAAAPGPGCRDTQALRALLADEWAARAHVCAGDTPADATAVLPRPLEARLPPPKHALHRAASQVEFQCAQGRLIGGHAFARTGHAAARRTVVPTVALERDATRAALARCKKHGVSVAHALFALCSVAWARLGPVRPELPMMMYSALNLRPHLTRAPDECASYWFLAVGYFNVILPAFVPGGGGVHGTFWARARAARAQSVRAAGTALLAGRTLCMAAERAARAQVFARADDGGAALPTPAPTPTRTPTPARTRTRGPSAALVGLSLLGNLDGVYAHGALDARVVLHTLTTGSRQRAGGMLLFGYTFAGRLWLSLGYDEGAYGPIVGGEVGRWWQGLVSGLEEFLVRGEGA